MAEWYDNKPCNGLKVLDLSGILAGPLTGSFFAELGAEVIKIENKLTGGDATRQWKLPIEDQESPFSAYYYSANFGKKIFTKDLTIPDERIELEKIIAQSDVIISNFQKKTAEKLGLLPMDIIKKYPTVIFAQLSAYNFDDPRPGYDLVMQGETGWISMNGTDDDHLAKLPVAIVDVVAAHQMKEGILIALLKKAKTGAGSVVHVSLYKSSISALVNQASNYLNAGHIPTPIGTLHPNIAPYGDVFKSEDNMKFILAVGSDAQFKKLWFTLISDAEDYGTFEFNFGRVNHRKALQIKLQQHFSKLSFDQIKNLIQYINVPFCLIMNMHDVFTNDLAREMVLPMKAEKGNVFSISNIAFDIS